MPTLLLLCTLVLTLGAESYESHVERLRLDPSLRALKYTIHAQHYSAEAAAALDDMQLLFGVDNLPVEAPAFDRYLPTAKVIGFNQKFSNARHEAAALSREVAQSSTLAAHYALRQLEARLYTALKTQKYSTQQLQNLREQKRLLTQIESELNNRFYSGQDVSARLSMNDERAFKIEALHLQTQQQLVSTEHELVRLVGTVPHLDSIPQKTLLPWREETLFPLQLARQERDIALAKTAVANAKNSPDFTLQFLYKQREEGATFDGEDWVTLRGVMRIPTWGQRDAAHRSALAQESAAVHREALESLQWQERMNNLVLEIRTKNEYIALLQAREKAIDQTITAQEHRYDVGHGDDTEVLESRLRALETAYERMALQIQRERLIAEHNAHIHKE